MKWALNISMNRDYFTEITNQIFVKRKTGDFARSHSDYYCDEKGLWVLG